MRNEGEKKKSKNTDEREMESKGMKLGRNKSRRGKDRGLR